MSRLRIQLEGSLPWNPLFVSEVMGELFPKIVFLPHKEAREFVRKLKLGSANEWKKYCKSNKKSSNIPFNPDRHYKNKGWVSWGDFLGTESICSRDRMFLPFEDAREFAISLKLKNMMEWQEYAKSDKRPDNVPSHPRYVYKNKGWIGIGNWLGTNSIASKDKVFLSFEEARCFVRNLKLKGHKEWGEYCRSGEKSENIPTTPNIIYKDEGWTNWGDWLGTGRSIGNWLPFKEAREFVRNLRLKNQKEWGEYCKSGNRPNNIPSDPYSVYKNEGWTSFGNWTGTGNIYKKDFLSFEEVREFIRNLGIKNQKEWGEYCKSGNRPNNIPSHPDETYKNREWSGWGDFLGTGTNRGNWMPFEEARDLVRKLKLKSKKEWHEYCGSGKKPNNIPVKPERIYKGWVGVGDWLGTGRIADQNKVFQSYKKAKNFVKKLQLRGKKEWGEYCKSGKKPDDIPAGPSSTYKDKGWISWGDFLGKT